jgi:outer membrane protein assembly factor BamB
MNLLPSLLRRTAAISAFFALLISILLIVTYIQLQRTDPLNAPALNYLNEQLKHDPGNVKLQENIRQLDLLARKAFFTSQWQIRTGGLLLAVSLLILVISLKWLEIITPKIPGIPETSTENIWFRKKIQRRWILIAGGVVVLTSLVMAWLTHQSLSSPGEVKATATPASHSDSSQQPTSNSSLPASDSSATGADTSSMATAQTDGYPTDQELRANFTCFRGYGGNGIVFHKNIPLSWDGASGKNIRWKTEIPLPGFNSPVIWENRIYLSGAKEKRKEVYCIDAITGKMIWTTDLSKIPGSPEQVPKVIAETGQAAPTMTTDGRRVYVIFANADLAALDMDGKIVWSKNLGLPKNHYGHSSSLVMFRDLLIIQWDQSGSARVMALAGKTGEKVWETSRNVKISWASPVIINTGKRTELILAAEPSVTSYDPSNGKELWSLECISGEVGPSVAYSNGMVFSVNDYSKLAAVKLGETPSLLWENDEYLSDVPSPVAFNDLVFVVTSYGAVAGYDAATGEKGQVRELEKTVYASPMIAEGKLFILDKTGMMHILKADKSLEEVGKSALGEGSSCTPAFGTGTIYIRGNKHLFCIGK